jgi:uncharacterized membrane protein YeaQ/YmgE (transglycosylase-associated protein family)
MLQPWVLIGVIGLIAGALAHYVIPRKSPGGMVGTALVGMVGALACAWLGRYFGMTVPGGTSGFVTAVIGSGLVLTIWQLVAGRKE